MKLNIACEEAIEPQCRHFRACGGCRFQHVPYDVQLEQKEAFIRECFPYHSIEPILPSDPIWGYRNKMEFSFSQARSGEKFLGLMKRQGRVENLNECHLAPPWFIQVLKQVKEWWLETPHQAYHPPSNQGLLRNLTVRGGLHTGEKMVVLTVSEDPFDDESLAGFIDSLPPVDSLILRKQIIQRKTPTRFEETLLKGASYIHETLHTAEGVPYRFRIKAASFFQPNTLQAEVIYQKVMEYIQPKEQILDLYCGTGALGIFAASQAAKVIGIELVPEAVQDAHVNLSLNQISNMEVFEGDVSEKLAEIHFQPTTVIVDPPRVGLGPKAIAELLRLNPEKIVYVSCNPVTQAADCEALGYTITCLQPIDQFPHTPHVENIALLKRVSL